jgi:hypothetical protein
MKNIGIEMINEAITRAYENGMTDQDAEKKHAFERIYRQFHHAIAHEHDNTSGGPLTFTECLDCIAVFLGGGIRKFMEDESPEKTLAVAMRFCKIVLDTVAHPDD